MRVLTLEKTRQSSRTSFVSENGRGDTTKIANAGAGSPPPPPVGGGETEIRTVDHIPIEDDVKVAKFLVHGFRNSFLPALAKPLPKKRPCCEEGVGRWTREEHEIFLQGLRMHGKEWKTIASMMGTRTARQVRSHAQKYLKAGRTLPDQAPNQEQEPSNAVCVSPDHEKPSKRGPIDASIWSNCGSVTAAVPPDAQEDSMRTSPVSSLTFQTTQPAELSTPNPEGLQVLSSVLATSTNTLIDQIKYLPDSQSVPVEYSYDERDEDKLDEQVKVLRREFDYLLWGSDGMERADFLVVPKDVLGLLRDVWNLNEDPSMTDRVGKRLVPVCFHCTGNQSTAIFFLTTFLPCVVPCHRSSPFFQTCSIYCFKLLAFQLLVTCSTPLFSDHLEGRE